MGLAEYGMVAQIAAGVVTAAGVIVSMWLSVKALREVEVDRKLRQKPVLAFEPGGIQLMVEFLRVGWAIPGINPKWAEKAFANIPDAAESVRLRTIDAEGGTKFQLYGHLANYGLGPALSTKVTWIPQEIWIGSEKFAMDDGKLSEPGYDRSFNTMPSIPSHILPGKKARLSRLPTFIDKDIEKKTKQVTGWLEIRCEDVFGEQHKTVQEFYLLMDYGRTEPCIYVTFGDICEY